MFKAISQGIYKLVNLPVYGKQDLGISPAGVMDRFSFESGNMLLENEQNSEAFEMVYPPRFEAMEDTLFVITGGKCTKVWLKEGEKSRTVPHGKVMKAERGAVLEFTGKEYGFRTYLCMKPCTPGDPSPEGRERPLFDSIAKWIDPENKIRVIRGPEYQYMENPDDFIKEAWTLTTDVSDMGIRISNTDKILQMNMSGNMISEAVSDGTIQLTPKGPIILLKHRQTIGGYPRIYNVIGADLDLLAQYAPGQVIHFREIETDEAIQLLRIKKENLNTLQAQENL